MSTNESQEEYEEALGDIKRSDDAHKRDKSQSDLAGVQKKEGNGNQQYFVSPVWQILIQAFTLTFLAEWGDRSQLATIILAAREDIYGVTLGGILGNALCTGMAVVGGRLIGQKISVKAVSIIGGIVFLLFAATNFLFDPVVVN